MKNSRLLAALCAAVFSFITLPTHAALSYVLGGQAVYDDVADLSWTTNANINGEMNWADANAWAAGLNVAGVSGWRLPTTLQPDASCSSQIDPGGGFDLQGFGTGCTGSEMGNLYLTEGVANASPGLFSNVQFDLYWSSTEYAPDTDPDLAWSFLFTTGIQNLNYRNFTLYAWAVQSGNVGAITSVTIDIKPRKNPKNKIDLKKDKELKVAIVGSDTFDALQVDPSTVKFGPSEASPINFKGQDYNRDGYSDLILIFNLSATGIVCGVTEATLSGETVPDPVTSITGSDSFSVEPCN